MFEYIVLVMSIQKILYEEIVVPNNNITLKETCKGDAIFTDLDNKLREIGLPWDQYVGVCTDKAWSIIGKRQLLKENILHVALHVNFTYYINIHRESLANKTPIPELNRAFEISQNSKFHKVMGTECQIVHHTFYGDGFELRGFTVPHRDQMALTRQISRTCIR